MTYLEIIKLWRFDSYGPFFLSGFQDDRMAFFGCGSWLRMGKSAWSHWPVAGRARGLWGSNVLAGGCSAAGPHAPSLFLRPFVCFSTLWHYRRAETHREGDNVPANGQAGARPGARGWWNSRAPPPPRGRGHRPLRVLQGENKWICSTVNRNNWTSISSAPNFSIQRPIWLNF